MDANVLQAEHAVRSNECIQVWIHNLRIEIYFARDPVIVSQAECILQAGSHLQHMP